MIHTNLNNTILQALLEVRINYSEAKRDNAYFISNSLGMITITDVFLRSEETDNLKEQIKKILIESSSNKTNFKEAIDKISQDGFFYEEDFYKYGNMHLKMLSEKCYIHIYQAFEVFLAECFACLFWFFPLFMVKASVDIRDIFSNDNILTLRRNVIEQRVKETVQSNNIKNIILKFRDVFGVKISIPEDDLKSIIVISNNRHLLLHNQGIVNNSYMQNLKYEGIDSEYKIGDKILFNLKDQSQCSDQLDKAVDTIYDSITSQIPQIENYLKSKLT